ncbi:MAG: dehydratase [Hamadaea sp.]|uniref:MaoC/PaaZ C-terminal domain-containing protein n=1 Tax=Hamadaea sp. TaxID=2024425 RepID=UPI0017BD54E6|nr:MaoC/PaaZ C-terminal domain-containing protein [Hamadaea sp.]NUR73929.1 dehydratase [Hamadaea sp.]NUT19596.1 dehydratase [Hamadaea sp.]
MITPEQTIAYAKATNDPIPEHLSGELAPPVFAIVPVWEVVVEAVMGAAPLEALALILHGEQDIRIHRPITPGMELRSAATVIGVRPKASGTSVVVRTATHAGNDLVNEQVITAFIREWTGVAYGDSAPPHDFDEALRIGPGTSVTARLDPDQTFRYSEASGDPMPIHLDDGIARRAGLPGIIAHGLCTMAFASWAAITAVGGGDPRTLRRLAVRFSRPVLPGQEITHSFWPVTPGIAQFETVSDSGDVVLRNGLAEFGEPLR